VSATLYIANTHTLELSGLKSAVEGVAIEDAAVTAVVTARNGTPIGGQTWPVEMEHVEDGLYRATLSHALEVRAGQDLFIEITVDAGTNRRGFWKWPAKAEQRT
jgi:hypothetical protein